ncbi:MULTISPECIES: APH(3') family aminoglycoside O-phosphotransferase [Xanthomonas]|uniref:APH(3') family aminoglycoside O-phosphotransferase n=1 Tax=Xanthomonas TaxID=338 RepID=UPI001ADC78C3|nr:MULTISPECIES: APH(3') family aminoglycoside O-phosphotransferase [unclassified Xanthomonas]MBO9872250.1 aminoglycoside 3'-phosphotransferase [Xanthomonas sp. D-93]WNH45904.1 aminoglycoside 3'-phosphotransferase [Xanthomonas sp. A6251]
MDDVAPREIPATAPALPPTLSARLHGLHWHRNLVGEAGAQVYRLGGAGTPDLYLKRGTGTSHDDVVDEFARLHCLRGTRGVPRVLHFEADAAGAWLLSEALLGKTAYQWLQEAPAQAERIVQALAEFLRAFHATPIDTCPFDASHPLRLAAAQRRLQAGQVDTEDFNEARAGWSADAVWQAMTALLPLASERVLCHGDYSLDNILLDAPDRVVGVIDLGRAGVADPYQDLAILANCLDEFGPALADHFFAAYGIATPDLTRLQFHQLLDEFF